MKNGITKQVLAGLLAGAMVLALAACNQQQTQQPSQSTGLEATSSAPATQLAPGVAQTTAGQVQGTELDGVYRYLGVPYAQAAERFVPTGPVEPWEGVRTADAYGSMSPQGSISGIGGASGQSGTDNNCQNLNIWPPRPARWGKAPGDGLAAWRRILHWIGQRGWL